MALSLQSIKLYQELRGSLLYRPISYSLGSLGSFFLLIVMMMMMVMMIIVMVVIIIMGKRWKKVYGHAVMKIPTNTNREETTQIVRRKWLFTVAAELGKRPFDEMGVSLPEAA